eukprot:2699173-Alexandrium_andersonii.AAC.1
MPRSDTGLFDLKCLTISHRLNWGGAEVIKDTATRKVWRAPHRDASHISILRPGSPARGPPGDRPSADWGSRRRPIADAAGVLQGGGVGAGGAGLAR